MLGSKATQATLENEIRKFHETFTKLMNNEITQEMNRWLKRSLERIAKEEDLQDVIFMNLRLLSSEKQQKQQLETFRTSFKDILDSLLINNLNQPTFSLTICRGITREFSSSKDFLQGIKDAKEKPDLQYLSLLKEERTKPINNFGQVEIDQLLQAMKTHPNMLGLHLDLKNIALTRDQIQQVSQGVQNVCVDLKSFGLDLGNGNYESSLITDVLNAVEKHENIHSLALSFFEANQFTSENMNHLIDRVLTPRAQRLTFLRLNLAQIEISGVLMLKLQECIKTMTNLTDLEIFVGGNNNLKDLEAHHFIDLPNYLKELKSFEIDLGYSAVTKSILARMIMNSQHYEKFTRFSLYLNGALKMEEFSTSVIQLVRKMKALKELKIEICNSPQSGEALALKKSLSSVNLNTLVVKG